MSALHLTIQVTILVKRYTFKLYMCVNIICDGTEMHAPDRNREDRCNQNTYSFFRSHDPLDRVSFVSAFEHFWSDGDRRKKKAVTSMPTNTPITNPTTAPTIVQVWSFRGVELEVSIPPMLRVSMRMGERAVMLMRSIGVLTFVTER